MKDHQTCEPGVGLVTGAECDSNTAKRASAQASEGGCFRPFAHSYRGLFQEVWKAPKKPTAEAAIESCLSLKTEEGLTLVNQEQILR